MLVFERKKRQVFIGRGIVTSTGIGDFLTSAVNFLSANKDTISNVANVVGNVAKATSDTAVSVKNIYDVVKARKKNDGSGLPKPVQKALTRKSQEIIERLASK